MWSPFLYQRINEDAHVYDDVSDRLEEREYHREHLNQTVMVTLEFNLLGC